MNTIEIKVKGFRISVPLITEDIVQLMAAVKTASKPPKSEQVSKIEQKIKEASKPQKQPKKQSKKPKTIDEIAGIKKSIRKTVNSAYEQEVLALYTQKALDYSQLYTYSSSVKSSQYLTEWDDFAKVVSIDMQHEDDFFKPKMDYSLIREVIRAKKMKDTYGAEWYVSPVKKAMFELWNMLNSNETQILYTLVSV